MNGYKNIIKCQSTRLKILKSLRLIPDKTMIQLQYRIKTGRKLNLKNPIRYSEKIQWYKLYYRNPVMNTCVDKYTVRKYISEHGYNYILNDLIAVYETAEQISFDKLPNQFALKCSEGSGLNYFVYDKTKENAEDIKSMCAEWLKDESYLYGREWAYKDAKPSIIVEKLLPQNSEGNIPDYKFFCFGGKVYCLYVRIGFSDNHNKGKIGIYDREFNQLPYSRSEIPIIDHEVQRPECFFEMIEIAENLSKDFPHVRVDLYDVNGKPVFGELTFYNASGYVVFEPDEFDFLLGEQFKLPKGKDKNEKGELR